MLVVTILILLTVFRSALTLDQRNESVEVVTTEQVPFAVIVLCNNNKMFCTGTLVHEQWVLTAANCMYDMTGTYTEDDESVTVIAGTNSLNDSTEDLKSGKAQSRQSERVIVHNAYSWAENFVNDLVLIKVKTPFAKTKTVAPAPLMNTTKPDDETPDRQTDIDINPNVRDTSTFLCDGYGFGKLYRWTSNKRDFALKIQQYEVGKRCHCLEKIRSKRSPFNILRKRDSFVCDEVSSYTGLCTGDDGGQLICKKQLRAIATTLFHYQVQGDECLMRDDGKQNECGDINTLSVFTDLCLFSQWLHQWVPDYPLTDDNCHAINSTVVVINTNV